jgi:hypothetical protein
MPSKRALYALFELLVIILSCKKNKTPAPVPERPYVTDVYVVGFKVINYASYGIFWKNGQQVSITADANSAINAVAVQDTDVYLAGRNGTGATYWKNGRAFFIANGLSELFAIAVSGNDVYVAGRSWQAGNQYGRAAYWKNGVETDLTDGTAPACVYSIVLHGGDIYMAGFYNQGQNAIPRANLWRPLGKTKHYWRWTAQPPMYPVAQPLKALP